MPKITWGECNKCSSIPIRWCPFNAQLMRKTVSIAIVGDFDPKNRSHPATNEAVEHCGAAVGLHAEPDWIGTEEMVEPGSTERLKGFDGVWIAPASPYKSMEGVLCAIRIAREGRIPLLGTCGG